jgi:hypothetical protein
LKQLWLAKPFRKKKLTSEEIKKILVSKNRIDSNQFKETHVTLIEDEADADRYTKKSKDKKSTEKSTVERLMNFGSLKFNPRYCNHP